MPSPAAHAALVQRCLAKEPTAWNEFLANYGRLIFWAIQERLKRVGCPALPSEVDDIFQNVVTSLWEKEKLRQLRDPETLPAWLVMVAGNAAVNAMKRRAPEDPMDPAKQAFIAAETPAPWGEEAEEEPARRAEELLKTLPARDQAALRLHYLHGKKYKDIAELLGIPVNTVGTIISRAKEKLRNQVKET